MSDKPEEQTPTATALLRAEIDRFLKSKTPEVLCIRGKWGVGKTFAWEMFLREAHKAEPLGKKYAYVSLFGLDTLDKFKSAIFENTVPITKIGTEPTLATLDINLRQASTNLLKAIRPNLAAAADQVSFLAVQDLIICIDDLERKGENLRIIDVLGLASLLKERRKCKVVLILNEEELDEADQKAFSLYSEKVIDSSLIFAPTPEESVAIAIKGTSPHEKLLADKCVKLRIANIRILKKLERLVSLVEPILRGYDDRILQQAVTTLALFGWAVYGKQDDLLDFALTKRYRSRFGLNDGKLSDIEKGFDDLLEKYGFGLTDEFDKVLLDGIKSGFFDAPKLRAAANPLQKQFADKAAQDALNDPWQKYRDSFDDNGDEIATDLVAVAKKHIDSVSISYLDAAANFLKRMGCPDEAKELISLFMQHNANEPRSNFDVTDGIQRPTDPDLLKALTDKHSSFTDTRKPSDVLFQIAKDSGWNDDDAELLAKLSSDDFYEMFKTLRGLELRAVVRQALEFNRRGLQMSNETYKAIGTRALLAVRRLGDDSKVNAERIKGLYNIGQKNNFLKEN